MVKYCEKLEKIIAKMKSLALSRSLTILNFFFQISDKETYFSRHAHCSFEIAHVNIISNIYTFYIELSSAMIKIPFEELSESFETTLYICSKLVGGANKPTLQVELYSTLKDVLK